MIITVGGIKGGTGKTTLACELAYFFSLETNKDIALLDTDEQLSAVTFIDQRRESLQLADIPCFQRTDKGKYEGIFHEARELDKKYDIVIIDVGAQDTSGQRIALAASDLFIAVFAPQSLPLWTIENVEKMVREVKIHNPDLEGIALLNMGYTRGNDNQDALDYLKDKCAQLKICPVIVNSRKIFSDASAFGLSVLEMKRKDKKAINEINAVNQFIKQEIIV